VEFQTIITSLAFTPMDPKYHQPIPNSTTIHKNVEILRKLANSAAQLKTAFRGKLWLIDITMKKLDVRDPNR